VSLQENQVLSRKNYLWNIFRR